MKSAARTVLCALGLTLASLVQSPIAAAESAGAHVGIQISEDGARMIRDWRRARGLPQAPELSDEAQRTNDFTANCNGAGGHASVADSEATCA